MAKIQIKSEKLTPFGGIFSIMEQFDALLAQTIDSTLGLRCTMFGYQYSEILRSLMCVYLCGGSCDYGHKERAGGAAVVIEHNSNIISRDVISNLHTTEFRMMLTLMAKAMVELSIQRATMVVMPS